MLRIIREGQRWLTALFVVGIGFVFVFFLGLSGPLTGPPPGSVASVGPFSFGFREFERARRVREDTFQNQLGDEYDARRFRDTLDDLALRDLVDGALLAITAQELGMRVSKREIERKIELDSGFRSAEGNFDVEAFRNFVDYEYGGERAFLLAQQPSELSRKMRRLLVTQPHISEGEAELAMRRELEEVRLAFVTIDASPSDTLEIDESLIAEALETRRQEIAARFESQRERFDSPEQVHPRHILVRVDPKALEDVREAARARAQDLRERIEGGEDFEEVARELSEDEASSASGGDLGVLRRGQTVKAFETAAFDALPGELVGPVESSLGFHLIRVDRHDQAVTWTLEQVSGELAIELLREDAADREAQANAEEIAGEVSAGKSLEDAARERDLTLGRSGLLKRRGDGYVPGLGASPDLLATAFALEPGTSSPRVFRVGNQLALVASLERVEADAETLMERLEETRAQMRIERINTRAQTWVDDQRDALLDAGMLEVDLASVRR